MAYNEKEHKKSIIDNKKNIFTKNNQQNVRTSTFLYIYLQLRAKETDIPMTHTPNGTHTPAARKTEIPNTTIT